MSRLVFAFLCICCWAQLSIAQLPDLATIQKLHNSSKALTSHLERASINASLYKQIRPRAMITNTSLSTDEIDTKVRSYVNEKYATALIQNYTHLYEKLANAKQPFSDCAALKPIDSSADVLMALCAEQKGTQVLVRYMTNGFNRGWSQSTVFSFSAKQDSLFLSDIMLKMKEGQKAYVEGL